MAPLETVTPDLRRDLVLLQSVLDQVRSVYDAEPAKGILDHLRDDAGFDLPALLRFFRMAFIEGYRGKRLVELLPEHGKSLDQAFRALTAFMDAHPLCKELLDHKKRDEQRLPRARFGSDYPAVVRCQEALAQKENILGNWLIGDTNPLNIAKSITIDGKNLLAILQESNMGPAVVALTEIQKSQDASLKKSAEAFLKCLNWLKHLTISYANGYFIEDFALKTFSDFVSEILQANPLPAAKEPARALQFQRL